MRTNVYVVSYTQKLLALTYNYKIGDTILDKYTEIKRPLCMAKHIEQTISAANKFLGFIIRNSKDFTYVNTFKLFFTSYVLWKLEHASPLWYLIYKISFSNLEAAQKKCLKYPLYKSTRIFPQRGWDFIVCPLCLLKLIHFNISCSFRLSKTCFLITIVSSH